MSKMYSLTEVTKEDVDTAIHNYWKQRSLDLAEYEKRLKEWRESYKFSWWQRKVKKLHKLDAEDLLTELHGHPSVWRYKFSPYDSEIVELELWDRSFRHTLGAYGETWRDIASKLYFSGKESHLVSHSVLDWIMFWKDREFEGDDE